MPFLGDIGKVFFGGATTGDVVSTGALLKTGNPLLSTIAGNLAQTVADDFSKADFSIRQDDGPYLGLLKKSKMEFWDK